MRREELDNLPYQLFILGPVLITAVVCNCLLSHIMSDEDVEVTKERAKKALALMGRVLRLDPGNHEAVNA